ncbi:MAG: transcriptional regulator [Armatimonadota bacterium]|nr:MAG: transcriptional regulator [Armatimonadota bacterium]
MTSAHQARILTLAQEGLELCPEPFAALARRAGVSVDAVLATLERARREGLVREISGIFDGRALGYCTALAAMAVPPDALEHAASVVSAHPGVSHNYARNHSYSLWFTLAVPPGVSIEEESRRLAQQAGGWKLRLFPALRTFKLGVRFDLEEGAAAAGQGSAPLDPPEPLALTERDILCVRALQMDLPITARPFGETAAVLGLSEEELLEGADRLHRRGALRRLAAVVRHRSVGFAGNIMSAWGVRGAELEEAARHLASLACVSHCYERPDYDDWPYRLFAMAHAASDEQCEQLLREAAARLGDPPVAFLKTVREFKKRRVRYFEPDSLLQ